MMMKRWLMGLLLVVGLATHAQAQVTIPNTFTTTVPVSQLNANFSTLGSSALNRTGGTITGNITVSNGVTVDGVDISAVLGGSGTPTFSTVVISSSSASALDVTGGINAGSSDVGIVDATGKIPAISSAYFANMSGANLTGLLFSQLTTTWSSPSYSAGTYTTNGAGGWTVDAGDVITNRYAIFGKTLFWNVLLTTTSVTAATGTELRIALPNSYTASTTGTLTGPLVGLNNGTAFTGFWQLDPSGTYVKLFVEPTAATPWTAAANTTQIRLMMVVEVQ